MMARALATSSAVTVTPNDEALICLGRSPSLRSTLRLASRQQPVLSAYGHSRGVDQAGLKYSRIIGSKASAQVGAKRWAKVKSARKKSA